MSKSSAISVSSNKTQKFEKLMDLSFGDYYLPCYWEQGKKSKNWVAKISPGTGKFMFNRKFIKSNNIDDEIMYNIKDLPEGTLVEYKCVFVHGQKKETTFGGLFILHHGDDGIYGEEMSQRQALEYFKSSSLPPAEKKQRKKELIMDLKKRIRLYNQKYGELLVSEVLVEILSEKLP